LIAEATAISEEGYGWCNAPMISTEENAANWKKVTDSVHDKGGKIYIQLWHMGRQAHSSFHPSTGDIVSASAIPVGSGMTKNNKGENVEYETPRALTVEQIKETVQDYVKAARLSKTAGFDGIEIHSANGYLLDQFLQSCSNQRNDEYGGSMENRARFLMDVLDAIIADGSFPADRIGIRLSPNGAFGGMGSEDNGVLFPWVAEKLSHYGLAYLHVMDGLGFGYHGKCPPVNAMQMKMAFKGPVMCNVGLTKDMAEGMLRSGACDLCCFGRLYISNPDLVERFENDWPLNPASSSHEDWWHAQGAKGYTDFPAYEEESNKA